MQSISEIKPCPYVNGFSSDNSDVSFMFKKYEGYSDFILFEEGKPTRCFRFTETDQPDECSETDMQKELVLTLSNIPPEGIRIMEPAKYPSIQIIPGIKINQTDCAETFERHLLISGLPATKNVNGGLTYKSDLVQELHTWFQYGVLHRQATPERESGYRDELRQTAVMLEKHVDELFPVENGKRHFAGAMMLSAAESIFEFLGELADCPDCNGIGWDIAPGKTENHEPVQVPCPRCSMTGKINPIEEKQNEAGR